MAEEPQKSNTPDANLANQDEKKEIKAPEVSHAQLKMINVSLQNQLNVAQRILLEIAETCTQEGTSLLNVSQNIKNLFKPPQQPGQQVQPGKPQQQPSK